MGLASKVFEQTSYSVVTQAIKLLLSTVSNIIIINALPRDQYGIVGIISGYYVFITWFAITPEDILLQRFKQIKENYFGDYISISYAFGLFRSLILLVLSSLLSLVVYVVTDSIAVAGLFIFYTAVQMITMQAGTAQFILRMDFQQKKIALWTLLHKSVMAMILLLLLLQPTVFVYYVLLMGIALLDLLALSYLLYKEQPFTLFVPFRKMIVSIKERVVTYSLWQHGIQILTKFIYEIDTVFLSLWVPLIVVGNYSIAIRIANFGLIIPMLIQQSTLLALTRQGTSEKRSRTVTIFTRYAAVISLLQVIGFAVVGKWYILLHTREAVDEIYLYTLILLIGVAVINTFRPFLALVTTHLDVRQFFFYSLLPAALFTAVVYAISSYQYGAMGIAVSNIICYSFWVLTIIIFIRRHSQYQWSWIGIAAEERALIQSVLRRIGLIGK